MFMKLSTPVAVSLLRQTKLMPSSDYLNRSRETQRSVLASTRPACNYGLSEQKE